MLTSTSSVPRASSGLAGLAAPAATAQPSEQARFSEILSIAQRGSPTNPAGGPAGASAQTPTERARDAAERFVAMTFVEPVLSSMREQNQAAAPFAPNQAEKQFRGMLDARLAEDIVRASNFPLVDRLARDLLREAPASGPGTAGGTDA